MKLYDFENLNSGSLMLVLSPFYLTVVLLTAVDDYIVALIIQCAISFIIFNMLFLKTTYTESERVYFEAIGQLYKIIDSGKKIEFEFDRDIIAVFSNNIRIYIHGNSYGSNRYEINSNSKTQYSLSFSKWSVIPNELKVILYSFLFSKTVENKVYTNFIKYHRNPDEYLSYINRNVVVFVSPHEEHCRNFFAELYKFCGDKLNHKLFFNYIKNYHDGVIGEKEMKKAQIKYNWSTV